MLKMCNAGHFGSALYQAAHSINVFVSAHLCIRRLRYIYVYNMRTPLTCMLQSHFNTH